MKSQKKECGARTRAGGNCRAPAAKNGRCKLHGGKSIGTPRGSQNALTHGIYSSFLTHEENEIAHSLKLGDIDDEIRLTKIRLMRALKRESESVDALELDSKVEREGGGPQLARLEETYKVRDYSSLIDKLTARIQSLERDRSMLVDAQLSAEIKRAEVNSLSGKQDDVPIGKITVEIVSARN